jgi:hypothetical protein
MLDHRPKRASANVLRPDKATVPGDYQAHHHWKSRNDADWTTMSPHSSLKVLSEF